MVLNKNPLGFFKYEHMEMLNGFAQMGISVKVD